MKIVIKFAGALLEQPETVKRLAAQVAALAKQGHRILVVHGGGRVFTATLGRMGIASRFVAGLRVTDRETRDVAVMVFAGLLNKQIAAELRIKLRTIKTHRGRVMQKMGVVSVAELVRLSQKASVVPTTHRPKGP